jgi:hypothetical protein
MMEADYLLGVYNSSLIMPEADIPHVKFHK